MFNGRPDLCGQVPDKHNRGVSTGGKQFYSIGQGGQAMPAGTSNETGGSRPVAAATYPWIASYPPGVSWDQEFTARPIYTLLDDAVAAHAASPFTNFLGRVTTYGEIGEAVSRAAAGLQKIGVGKGSKVGLLLPNSPTFIIY